MKAVSYTSYGSADVVQFKDVATPTPGPNEVLVRIHETIVTPSDIAGRTGTPFVVRFFSGLLRPRGIPGSDLAGIVAAVGAEVTRFQVGDRVFGSSSPSTGTHAEHICLPEGGVLATIPAGMAFEQTAGICDAAMTALTFLRDEARIQPGQKVLINGAAGSVGGFGVQLARHFGAEVTGVASGANEALVRELGASYFIDYTQADFTRGDQTYDIIFDAVGKRSFAECRRALKAGGVYLTTVPTLAILLQMVWTARIGPRRAVFAATGLNQTAEKLHFLRSLLEAGAIRSIVDRRYPWEEMAAAHRYVETGHKKGQVVITVAPERTPGTGDRENG